MTGLWMLFSTEARPLLPWGVAQFTESCRGDEALELGATLCTLLSELSEVSIEAALPQDLAHLATVEALESLSTATSTAASTELAREVSALSVAQTAAVCDVMGAPSVVRGWLHSL